MFSTDFLYIDPGSGSAIIAMIVGALAGFSIYIKIKWQSFRHKFKAYK